MSTDLDDDFLEPLYHQDLQNGDLLIPQCLQFLLEFILNFVTPGHSLHRKGKDAFLFQSSELVLWHFLKV
jgi:hypothetical protein